MLSRLLVALVLALGLIVTPSTVNAASPTKKTAAHSKHTTKRAKAPRSVNLATGTAYRGWDYLVERLIDNGVPKDELVALYTDKRMPERSFVPFSVKPREPASIYESFKRPEYRDKGIVFIEQNRLTFERVEAKLGVPREVVAAIIVVESQAGKYTGNHLILYRLSRLASTNAPDNLQLNYIEQKRKDPRITFADVRRRGSYLERTFLPEIPALLSIAKKNHVDALSIKGSVAGAVGLPQFLPSAILRYGLDGNEDGIISLHDETDAIWSAANYLAHFGYRREIPRQEKRAIIWRYNKSKSYIDTVLSLSAAIEGYSTTTASF